MSIGRTYDMVLGYAGVLMSTIASWSLSESIKYWVPWILGITFTLIAIYNQYQQSKIHRETIKKFKNDR
jgi:hypothetical protein